MIALLAVVIAVVCAACSFDVDGTLALDGDRRLEPRQAAADGNSDASVGDGAFGAGSNAKPIELGPRRQASGANYAVSETGTQTRFYVNLGLVPREVVTLTCAVESPTELEIAVSPQGVASDGGPHALAFSPTVTFYFAAKSEVGASREINVRGVDDSVRDGATTTRVSCRSTSFDSRFDGIEPEPVAIDNADDDSPAVLVTTSQLGTLHEAGGVGTFGVYLRTRPTANVTITIAVDDPTRAKVAPTVLVFTPQSWSSHQIVTVTSQNDFIEEAARPFAVDVAVTASTDPDYGIGLATSVAGTIVDDDHAGLDVSVSSIATTEAGGSPSFTAKLRSQPTTNVLVRVKSTREDEGKVVAPASGAIVFTPQNWQTPVSVRVQGVDDDFADGPTAYSIALAVDPNGTSDPQYVGVAATVNASNADDDVPGVLSVPGALSVTEGSAAALGLRLTAAPRSVVTVRVTSSGPELTPWSSTHYFDQNNWASVQNATFFAPLDCSYGAPTLLLTVEIVSAGGDPAYENAALDPARTPDAPVGIADAICTGSGGGQ